MDSCFNGRTAEGYDNVVVSLCNKLMHRIMALLIHGDILTLSLYVVTQ